MLGRVLEGQARLVGELAEIDFERVCGGPEHVDVGARAEDAVLGARDDDAAHLGMLEAQPLDGVGQLDVHTEVVAVGLEAVPLAQGPLLLDVHGERRDRRGGLELPVQVAGRVRLEANGVGLLLGSHGTASIGAGRAQVKYYSAL